MESATLAITGMTCGHCVAAVTSTLEAIDGVEVKTVTLGSATVGFDAAKVSVARLAQAVTEEGYVATVAR